MLSTELRLHLLGTGLALLPVLACAGLALSCLWPVDPDVLHNKDLPNRSLKVLALAMHEYHEKHGRLPPAAVYAEDGAPLLSWRVLLLPHLDQEVLFSQFKLDEPWDSPHNLQFLPRMPPVFAPIPARPPLEPYTTLFQVFVGKGAAFEGKNGLRLDRDFPRPSFTVLIVEAGKAVPWTKPDDIAYGENQPLPPLGGYFKDRFHLVLADGTPHVVRRDSQETTLRAAINRNGEGKWPWDD